MRNPFKILAKRFKAFFQRISLGDGNPPSNTDNKTSKITSRYQMFGDQNADIKTLANQNGWILVGISGCTNSGKTTVCEKLKKKFKSIIVINQDKFFREPDDSNHIYVKLDENLKHQNWECVGSMDWNKMMEEIRSIIAQPSGGSNGSRKLLVVDGHIIFNYKPFSAIFHRKYFIRAGNKESIYQRRLGRNYEPADPPGYFDQCVWPMYLKNLQDLQHDDDIVYIDGNLEMKHLFEVIYNDLHSFISVYS